MLEAAGPTHHVWHTGDGSTLDVGREGRQTIGHAWLVRQLRIHSCSSHLLPSSLTERLPKGTSVTCHSHLEKNEWMKWLEFLWFQREIKNPHICQISVLAFTETEFQFKFLNIKFSVLNSQFHNFYQIKIYPKKMFYKYIKLRGAEVLQFNLQNQRKTQDYIFPMTEITFSNTTGTLEDQTNFKSCDTLCILSTKHDFVHRQMGREGNI